MKAPASRLLEKAAESLRAAALLLENGLPAVSVSRAYYAMFYAAEALLAVEGLSFKSHHAVVAAFGERFAKAGRLDRDLHRDLMDAFRQRQRADYDPSVQITPDEAAELLTCAKNFVAVAGDLVEDHA